METEYDYPPGAGLATSANSGGFLDGLTLSGLLGAAATAYAGSRSAAPALPVPAPPAQVRSALRFNPWAIGAAVVAGLGFLYLLLRRGK